MLGRAISQILIVGAVFAGTSLVGATTAVAAPISTGSSTAGVDKANERLKAQKQRRSTPSVPDRSASVYGPYITSDQVRLVAD